MAGVLSDAMSGLHLRTVSTVVVDPFMPVFRNFGVEVANEILFIIADQNPCLTGQQLCQEFERRVGSELVHLVGIKGPEFVRSSPVLSHQSLTWSWTTQSWTTQIDPYQPTTWSSFVYMVNPNESYRLTYDNKYREMLLIQAWKLIETNGLINACCENTGNSAFHFLVGTPGATTPNLVRLLLQAGGEELALKTNRKDQNILHVIAGRMRAEKNSNGDLVFGNEKVEPIAWTAEDRKSILDVLSQELSSNGLTVLVKAQDEIGDTPIHEWALSTSTTVHESLDAFLPNPNHEIEIASQLLQFGAQLRLANNTGHVPLHYAFNTDVFEFLVQRCDVCHVRNDLDETPLMFMIKTIIRQALSQTCVNEYPELATEFLERASPKPVSVDELTHILDLFEECEEAKNTVGIPDINGNSIFDIVLSSIKIASYCFFNHPRFDNLYVEDKLLKEQSLIRLRRDLVSLLEIIMHTAQQDEIRNPFALHTLLNIHPRIGDLECVNTAIIESLDALLQQRVEPPFYDEIINKLVQNGARRAEPCKRQVRSRCPESHLQNATDLAKTIGTEDTVTVVGKYRYFHHLPIGSGAFSSVFLAIKDEHLDERSGIMHCNLFALKRVEKAKVNPKEITSEVKTLISLSNRNENIVRYYGLVEHSHDKFYQYICLELMDGDLEEFVTNGVNTALSVQLMKQIINGLEFLHEQGFIHRDLKPGNILYTTNPTLQFKIADFGLTKNIDSISSANYVAMAPGTRCWMAPELISMKSTEHTQQSDIFSLGLVLYYFFTLGKHPFETGTVIPPYVIEQRIVQTQVIFTFHPEAANFFQTLLSKDPSKRTPAKFLHQHPFLWSERKKIEFLKAVGDQPEAISPTKHPNSPLEQRLQTTKIGQIVQVVEWNLHPLIYALFAEITTTWKQKKYRTDEVIDLLRFIRNAYAHKQERSPVAQGYLDRNIFLQSYDSLVIDVLRVVQDLGFLKLTIQTVATFNKP
ncbi:probable myosin light chain kinase DDB_G0292624 [Paramuricea clavata]|uniref:Probable myosin light chain kinase DDB_G0292624 n=1 Tax=Paramuricea clavata TaxID=317549 RepID=A0A7D9I528_PARCT|nr:probable myosin light chain kinase DDB_G0292624 [Paramuricea clavata]